MCIRDSPSPGQYPGHIGAPLLELVARLPKQADERGSPCRPAELFDGPPHHGGDVCDQVACVGNDVVSLDAEHRLDDEIRLRTPPSVDGRCGRAGALSDGRQAHVEESVLLEQLDGRLQDCLLYTSRCV